MRGRAITAALAVMVVGILTALPQDGRSAESWRNYSGGDTVITAGDTLTLYPCFVRGGGRIHTGAFYTGANGCTKCARGFIKSFDGTITVQFWGTARIDTTQQRLDIGEVNTMVPVCDSIKVRVIGAGDTRVKWGYVR